MRGAKSGLVFEILRLRAALQEAFSHCHMEEVSENVASMREVDQKEMDKIAGVKPWRICPRHFSWIRRPRLYWSHAELGDQPDMRVEQKNRWTEVQFRAPRMGVSKWLPSNWRLQNPEALFPTFVRGVPKSKPPFMPAGLDTLAAHEKERYARHHFAYPPYQYKDCFMVSDGRRILQPLTSEMREVLMGYKRGSSYVCWPNEQRRRDPKGHELARCSLMGNTFCAPVMAWVLSRTLVKWGLISRSPTAAELSDPSRPFSLAAVRPADTDVLVDAASAVSSETKGVSRSARVLRSPDAASAVSVSGDQALGPLDAASAVSCGPEDQEDVLLRHLMHFSTHRGGELRQWSLGTLKGSAVTQGIDIKMWKWKTVIANTWEREGEHINQLEARAYVLALRWRLRSTKGVGTRFLHAVDSLVTMGAMVKGRSSSRRLRHIVLRANALLLAGHLHPSLVYVRSHENPADAPSRVVKKIHLKTKPHTANCASRRGRCQK